MERFLESIRHFFAPLSLAQRVIFCGLVLATLVVAGMMMYWALRPDYTLLFGSLPAESAREITSELEERGVPYRLEDNGRAILVPAARVHEMRLQLASEGLAQPDVQGYELFDENALGMTDFMQQVNNKRALEGELARSINTLEQVEFSRVHLVLPERRPFRESSVEASASVLITLQRGRSLGDRQIQGITALIAGSVEGLEAGSVTVLDQNGNRLTDGLESHADFASGSLQIQVRKQTESYLTERGQTMLDRVLGPGNSILRVSAEHDFDRLVRESDLIDPDSRTILSEERRSEASSDETMEQVPVDEFTPLDRRGETVITSNRDNEYQLQTRNYEMNRTREIYEKTQGEIRRLNASVLVNYKQMTRPGEDGAPVGVSEPYTAEEIRELQEVVRLALGIRPDRGDELTITQIEFFEPEMFGEPGPLEYPGLWPEILRWLVILAAFGAILYLINGIRKRMEESNSLLPAGRRQDVGSITWVRDDDDAQIGEEDIDGFIDRKLSGQARRQLRQKEYVLEEIKDFVDMKPSEAAQVMRALMISEEKG